MATYRMSLRDMRDILDLHGQAKISTPHTARARDAGRMLGSKFVDEP